MIHGKFSSYQLCTVTTMKECVWCDRRLLPSPTKRWHFTKNATQGICHECVIGLTKMLLISLEKEVTEPAHTPDADIVADSKACPHCDDPDCHWLLHG